MKVMVSLLHSGSDQVKSAMICAFDTKHTNIIERRITLFFIVIIGFFVNGIAYTGSYSELFPDGTAYNLNVVDENGCSEFFLSGNHNCGCTTNAGSMIDINPHYSCDSLCVDTRRLTLQLYKCITMS